MRGGRVPRLHVVTDDRVLAARGFIERARAVLAAGGAGLALHLRGPGTSGRALHELAVALRASASGAGAALLANDRVDVALTARLDGAQLGARSLPVAEARRLLPAGALVGISVHGADEAIRRAGGGPGAPDADFLVVGTIFATPSHPDRPAAGPALLSGVRDRVPSPLVAIGGVGPERVAEVVAAGAWGVAALSGVWGAGDPAVATRAYLDALEAS